MAEPRKFDYFLLRYVPNAVGGEFVNVGAVMIESEGGGFGGVYFTKDWRHARLIDPHIDIDVLEALGRELQQRIEDAGTRAEILYRMMDSWSNVVQLSAIRQCFAEDPVHELQALGRRLVEIPVPGDSVGEEEQSQRRAGRKWIRSVMSEAFRSEGVWDLLMKNVPAAPYTNEKDDFTFDFGYTIGNEIKLFHAVSLIDVGQDTRMFPLRVAKIGPKMAQISEARPHFTAVVEDDYDEKNEAVETVLAFMKGEEIRVARLREMPAIAKEARLELRA